VSKQKLNLLQFSSGRMAQRLRSCGAGPVKPSLAAYCFTTCQTNRSVTPPPQRFPARQAHRKTVPPDKLAAAVQRSSVPFTQSGTGTVRMCPPFPTRSTMAQCSSRCCRWRKLQIGYSRRRSLHPSRTAIMARSRWLLSECGSGACQSRRPSSAVSQFPSLTPNFLTPFTRRMPAASSGPSKPASAASFARRRTAASRLLMVPLQGAGSRDKSCIG
jgi:hypothetical protein